MPTRRQHWYKNEDRYIGFDLITTKAVLKKLALFHAIPIALKIVKPEQFKILKDLLDASIPPGPPGPPDHDGPNGPRPFGPPDGERQEDILLKIMSDVPDFAPYISRVTPMLNKPHGPMFLSQMAPEPWNSINHNDFWVNNIMVKPIEKKEPLIKLVDFQMCLYGTFAKDLVFFLLSSVRNDVIKEHFDDFLRYYYDEFMAILNITKTNLTLPYSDYLEEVKKVANSSEAAHAMTFSTIIFGEKGTGVDTAVMGFNPSMMNDMARKMNRYQKEKIVVIASEAAKRGWI